MIKMTNSGVDLQMNAHKNITEWTTDLTDMPDLSFQKIHDYFVNAISNDGQKREAMKHKTSGYQLFKDGYVKKVKVKGHFVINNDSRFIINNQCTATMKATTYNVVIHLSETDGHVLYAFCPCKSGAGGSCKHVAATLYQLVEYKELDIKSVPADKTCTDVLQAWHIPGEGSNTGALKFSALTFYKADLSKDLNNKRKRPVVTGKRSFCATPLFAHQPSVKKLKKLSDDLIEIGQGIQLSQLIKANQYEGSNFYSTSITEYNERQNVVKTRPVITEIVRSLSESKMTTILSATNYEFVRDHLTMTSTQIINLENETTQQSSCSRWFEERKKRITASTFSLVMNRRKGYHPKSIITAITGKKKDYQSVACKWGSTNESIAIQYYEEQNEVNVQSCGFVVNPKWPWLGASPDGVMEIKGVKKAIEVKCPYSKKDLTIEESCMDSSFYLKKVDNKIQLKRNHNYFYQCQGVMAILNFDFIDFIVYTTKDLFQETLIFQKEKWETHTLPELTNFYFEFIKDTVFNA